MSRQYRGHIINLRPSGEAQDPLLAAGCSILRDLPEVAEGVLFPLFGELGTENLVAGPRSGYLLVPEEVVSKELRAIGATATDEGAMEYITSVAQGLLDLRNKIARGQGTVADICFYGSTVGTVGPYETVDQALYSAQLVIDQMCG